MYKVLAAALLIMASSCHGDVTVVVDLTHELKEGESMTWPTNPDFNFTIMERRQFSQYNAWLENNYFGMPEHMGTHMDAPSHLRSSQGGWRMQQIPAEKFMGPGVVLDVRNKVDKDHQYKVTVQDLQSWESEHGRIPDKAIVLVNSGWASRYPDWNQVFGTDDIHNFTSFKFPSVSAEAATWLAGERYIHALGVDSPSPDTVVDNLVPVHKILLDKSILIVENVANLDQVPPTGTTIVLGALKIHEGSGAPMRLFAFSAGSTVQSTAAPQAFTAAFISLVVFCVWM